VIEPALSATSALQSPASVDSGEHFSGWQIEQKVSSIGAGAFTQNRRFVNAALQGRRALKGSVC